MNLRRIQRGARGNLGKKLKLRVWEGEQKRKAVFQRNRLARTQRVMDVVESR
jgi:hypothetical protein